MFSLAQTDTTDIVTNSGRLFDACGAEPSTTCRWVFEQTDNEFLATAADWVIDRPLSIIVILIGAFVLSRLAKRAIRHLSSEITDATTGDKLAGLRGSTAGRLLMEDGESARAASRAETLSTVLSSVASAVIWGLASLMILGELSIEIGPLIAGAGVAGIALGFGAQTVVRDFLTGLFMLIEDQFGVGDIIDVGQIGGPDIVGVVEKVSLRTTTLRDLQGTVWHVPNGEILRVANKSQLWSRALLDIEVSYDTDLRLAEGIIQRVANEMWENDDGPGVHILEEPEVWGVQSLGASGIALRLVIKTEPAEQWPIERELRLRIKEAFDEAGIEIPFPQQTMWVRSDDTPPRASAGDVPVVMPPRYRTGAGSEGRGEPEAEADGGGR
ncbi:MAG: mechanosensitive ion channel family protein [Acidimicrobiales bacterium]